MHLDSLLPLDLLRPGEWADVADISGDPKWVGRMAELGLREGCRIQMLLGGVPCMLEVSGCKLCLRGDSVSQIWVRPIEAASPIG